MNAIRLGLTRGWCLLTVTLAFALLTPRAFSAILTVTNLASLGAGTLRQALSDNQALGGGNTIVFAGNLSGTITLAGVLSVNSPVTILGPGTNVIAVNGNNAVQVFAVAAGPTLISDLTIRNGMATGTPGAGGQLDGQDGLGGGIYSIAALTISNCVVMSNTVVGGLGGDSHLGSIGRGGKGLGGGIYNSGGTLALINTSFTGNRALGGTGGSASGGGSNGAEGGDAYGGAVYTYLATNQIIRCSFANNQAQGGTGGTGGGGGVGGFGGNGRGAGIYNESVGSIWNSVVHHGSALGGTGGSGGNGTGANGSGYGGGLYVVSALALINSTIASNTAAGSATDWGGGVFNASTDYLGFTNCTCAGNEADSGGGLYGSATAANSIFAANIAATGPDVQGAVTSQDYNLFQNTNGLALTGAVAHNLTGQDPLLGWLQDSGGPTLTMALLPGSPAIDQGQSFGVTSDQRGAPRPFDFASISNASGGDGSDIGAFECGSPTLMLQVIGNDAVLSWPSYYGGFTAQSTTNAALSNGWTTVAGIPVVSSTQYLLTNSPVASDRFFRLKSN